MKILIRLTILIVIQFIFTEVRAQTYNVTISPTSSIAGSYSIRPLGGTYYVVLDFTGSSIESVNMHVTSSYGSIYYFHSCEYSCSPESGFTSGQDYTIDVNNGPQFFQIDYYAEVIFSWDGSINNYETSGTVLFENANLSNDLIIKDHTIKSMGSISSQSSSYSKANILIERTNGQKLGLNPNKISSNTSLGITSSSYIYQVGTRQYFRTGTTTVMTLNGGKVGIGTTTPSTKLEVRGKILADEIEVQNIAAIDVKLNGSLAANEITVNANGNTADFVFEENYSLRSLKEIEAFIKEKKHLPDIPSATEMEEKGVNMAEMNKLLLQKVEELTLYIIEQEKRIKNLESQDKVLENDLNGLKSIVYE